MSHIPDKIDSKYRYVLLASQRAEQILTGAMPKLDDSTAKPTRKAMSKISKEAVEWDYGPAEVPEEEATSEEAEASEGGEEAAAEVADS